MIGAWLRDPTPAGLLLYLVMLALISAVVCVAVSPARAEPIAPVTLRDDVDSDCEPSLTAVVRVDAMIAHLVSGAKRHPMNRPDWRRKMAKRIVIGATKIDAPVSVVTAIAFRESSFRWDVTGPASEKGLMQVHPDTVRRFKCDMSTVAGQIDCGCKVLAWHHDRCGSDWRAALAAYGSRTAKCNPRPGTKLRNMVDDRFRLAKELREISEQ